MARKSDDTAIAKKERPDIRKLLVVGAVFVIVVGAGVWWATHRKNSGVASSGPQYSGQALVDQVNQRYGRRDYLGAIQLLKAQKTINEPATQLLLAGAYTNAKNYQDALAIYEKLDKQNKLNEAYLATAADAAERAKQYQQAIDFYKKAKQKADPAATDQIAVYDYKITELEKKL